METQENPMKIHHGNIFDTIPDASQGEVFENFVAMTGEGVRVERIVSEGQASPDGFWYDQDWDEWVLILRGGAVVELSDPSWKKQMRQGDWLLLPAGTRHRVASTESPTLWLAVHAGKGKRAWE